MTTNKGLQVWLPLIKDLHNQGLNEAQPVAIGTPSFSATGGKLGGCYSFNNGKFTLSKGVESTDTSFTITFWIKITTSGRYIPYSQRNSYSGAGIMILIDTSFFYFDDGTRWNASFPTALSLNTWYHLCFTRTPSGKKLYVNGEKVLETTTVGNYNERTTNCTIGGDTLDNNFNLKGSMNDFRLYSYALSPQEIKELSRCKVGHWLGDGNGTSLPNLITGNYSIFKTSTGEIETGTISSISAATILANKGKTLCFSMRKYSKGARTNGISSTLGARFGIYWSCKYTRSGEASQWYYPMASFLTDASDGIVYCTWTIPSDLVSVESDLSPAVQTHGSDYARPTDAGVTWYITDVKLEWGTIPSLYSTSNQAFLSDISGFGRHGNITGGITLSSDTKRYDKSLNFSTSDGRAYASIVQPISNSPSAMTIAFWIKPDSASANSYRQCFSFNSNRNWLSINTENNKVWFYQGNTLYVRSSNGKLDSNWHHIAMVWNGSQYQFYIDGIANTTTYTSAPNYTLNIVAPQISTFIIGNNYTVTSHNGRLFKDYLSDIRLYATALSADDVKELYSLGH